MDKDVKEIMNEVKENHNRLDSCTRHDFSIDATPDKKFSKKYRCVHCNGEVDAMAKYWYEKGIEHAKTI